MSKESKKKSRIHANVGECEANVSEKNPLITKQLIQISWRNVPIRLATARNFVELSHRKTQLFCCCCDWTSISFLIPNATSDNF